MTSQTHAHLPRPVYKEPPAHAPNAALLIDFDNVTMGIRSDLQTELKRLLSSDLIKGKVAVQRAYADWRRYPQYVAPLSASSIDLIWAPAAGATKKNATDIRLAVDALELVFTRPEIGTFILLSGDSDFSSLVVKLKEYGKYVIGVGIRESSSDLLIQNCDEYYSYSELAGLTKESDVAYERRDPWELVVEAVKQMTAHNDVMRSDRLKQVMQEIDPSFNEKDLGYSRFSKFVVEAARKGFLTLTKLDNGQYEISLGPEVHGAPAQPAWGRGEPPREREERARSPQRSGEGRRRRAGGDGGGGRVSLGEAFGLLKQALFRLGGSDKSVSADELRDTMIELGAEAEPLERERFPKLLRQAHDAEIIDLSKEDDGAYAVRLRPEAVVAAQPEAEPEADEAAKDERESGDEEPLRASSVASEVASQPAPLAGIPARSARFRRGSRGLRVPPPEVQKIGVVEVDPNFKPRIELIPTRPVVPETLGTDSPPAAGGVPGSAPTEEERRGAGRGRGGSGRGGRGRGGGGGGGGGGAPARTEREQGEPGERGERGRSRRGGRGRSGRGRSDSEGRLSRPAREAQESLSHAAPPEPPAAPAAREPSPSPEREGRDSEGEGTAGGGGGESFWTRVKRGLIGE